MRTWTTELPYFPVHELRCKGSGELVLDMRFAAALPGLRVAWGRPLTPTSVCRSPAHNSAIGGHPRSLHLTANPVHRQASGTMAADLAWSNWLLEDQRSFYRLARSLGWSCGLHPGFIHVDRRAELGLAAVTFHYPSWDNRFPDE